MRKNKIETVILAAGKGRRLKKSTPKPFVKLNGLPLLAYSLKTFQAHPKVTSIILVTGKGSIRKAKEIVRKMGFTKVKAVVSGGKKRIDSVIRGLKEVSKQAKYVLIHDSARPFAGKRIIDGVLKALSKYKMAIPGNTFSDTVKETDFSGIVKKTLVRENLYRIQTPQGIHSLLIPDIISLSKKASSVYDEAVLLEKEEKVKVVKSDSANIKVTTPEDLAFAEFITQKQSSKNRLQWKK